MNTLLPIDAATTPHSLTIDPPMTDAQLEEFCRLNDVARIERTKEGVIRMNPPAGFYTSDGNAEIGGQLRAWWKTHRRGRTCDSNAGFYLPDGSLLSPDAAYISEERLRPLSRADLKGFPHVCPEFVIELLSPSDRLSEAMEKMQQWIANGVQLGWLIDPSQRKVFVYRPGAKALTVTSDTLPGDGLVAGFVLDLNEVWDRYDL